ncbi:MAG: CPXCG motif-containing cysteine-rich protein [Bacteroidota bacterium]
MDFLKAVSIQCPYCGETIEVVVDCSIPRQEYLEDCEVCCRPMTIFVNAAESDSPQVEARQEDE